MEVSNLHLPDWWGDTKPYKIMDCVKGMRELSDNVVDLVVTSPPYNVGKDYGPTCLDNMPYDNYLDWSVEWMSEVFRILKPTGRFCLNHFLGYLRQETENGVERYNVLMDMQWLATREIGFKYHSLAVWDDVSKPRLTSWGTFMSAKAPFVNNSMEAVLILYKDQWNRGVNGESTIDKKRFINLASGFWKMQPEPDRDNHPAMFPISLPYNCIQMFTYKDDIVLDPFLGSGTTIKACRMSDRCGLGFELSPAYEDMIKSKTLSNIAMLESFDKTTTLEEF